VCGPRSHLAAPGLSNFDAAQLDELLAMDLVVKPALVQNGYSVTARGHPQVGFWGGRDEHTFRYCVDHGITFQAYSPLGLWTLGGSEAVLDNPTVVAIARRHKKTAAQVAIRWLVQQGIAVVTATTSAAHVASDLLVFDDFTLTEEEMRAL
jgi:diketogulonate reductase-like aldo/keto reductase